MTIALPPREVDDLCARVAKWSAGRNSATVKEVLPLAGELHHVSIVVLLGRYFICRYLQLSNRHLSRTEWARGCRAWGRYGKQEGETRFSQLSREFMADMAWWRWFWR